MAKNYLRLSIGVIFVVCLLSGVSLGEGNGDRDDLLLVRIKSISSEIVNKLLALKSLYKIWKMYNEFIEVLVFPREMKNFEIQIQNIGTPYEILSHIPLTKLTYGIKQTRADDTMSWDSYKPLDVIYKWLDELEKTYPEVKTVIGGSTYEKRDIKGIEIEFGKNLTGVFLEAGTHAREWISPAATTWMINEILKSPKNSIFRQFNYIYFPIFNPDGYVYSWTKDRLWRKTRTPYPRGKKMCYGADPNRNWDFHWNTVGTSNDPCSEIYPGPYPFSEVETRTMSEFIKKNKVPKNIEVYLTFHSFSQTLLYPWGDKKESAPQKDIWDKLSKNAAKAFESVHQKKLKYGQGAVLLYPTSGPSDEWFYGTFNASVVFTIELRDSGADGFLLSPDQIVPSGEETLAALKSILTGSKQYQILKKIH